MGVGVQLVDFNRLFQEGRRDKLIINDLPESTEREKQKIDNAIYVKFDSNSLLSNVPSCECGETYGEVEIDNECPSCNTKVVDSLEQALEPLAWIRAPKGVAGIPNPVIWTMLTSKFRPNGFDLIRWFCDTSYSEPDREPPELSVVRSWGIERGLNNFINNFDFILENLYTLKRYRLKKGEVDPLYQLIQEQRGCIFSEYLPLPNRSLLVIEKNNMGIYVDPLINGALDAIRTLTSIDSPLRAFAVKIKENRMVKAMVLLSKYFHDLYASKLASKEGVFRKHVYGTRSHFSFRAVISSITDAHDYECLEISWGIGVSSLRLHLMNKLINQHGYSPNQASAFLYEHTQKYHPFLDALFMELIAEAPGKGIPCVFQRNPSLERGSAQAFYISRVKANVADPTVGLPILDVKGFNADFDGDQLNGTLSIDSYLAKKMEDLAPHKSAFDLSKPRTISRNEAIPNPVVSTIASYIHSPDAKIADPEIEKRMAQLLEPA